MLEGILLDFWSHPTVAQMRKSLNEADAVAAKTIGSMLVVTVPAMRCRAVAAAVEAMQRGRRATRLAE